MTKRTVTVSGNLNLPPIRIETAAPPSTYLGVATGMVQGAQALVSVSPVPSLALALVSAHALECILKAHLSRSGDDSALRKPPLNHDLEALWARAESDGLPLGGAPMWVVRLGEIHRSPYCLRYSTGIHVAVLPEPEPMVSELVALLEFVKCRL